eukprot:14815866-Heterocapsa_arctica.AAC.1
MACLDSQRGSEAGLLTGPDQGGGRQRGEDPREARRGPDQDPGGHPQDGGGDGRPWQRHGLRRDPLRARPEARAF